VGIPESIYNYIPDGALMTGFINGKLKIWTTAMSNVSYGVVFV